MLPEVGTKRTHASQWLSQDSRSQACCLFAAAGSTWSPTQAFCLVPIQQAIIFQQTFSSMGCLFRLARLEGFFIYLCSFKANHFLSLFVGRAGLRTLSKMYTSVGRYILWIATLGHILLFLILRTIQSKISTHLLPAKVKKENILPMFQ